MRTLASAALARGPARALRRERLALNQTTREIRAASERRRRRAPLASAGSPLVLERALRRAAGRRNGATAQALRQAEVALRAHDPERTLERGYALAETGDGEPMTSAAAARAGERIVCASPMARLRVETGERETR